MCSPGNRADCGDGRWPSGGWSFHHLPSPSPALRGGSLSLAGLGRFGWGEAAPCPSPEPRGRTPCRERRLGFPGQTPIGRPRSNKPGLSKDGEARRGRGGLSSLSAGAPQLRFGALRGRQGACKAGTVSRRFRASLGCQETGVCHPRMPGYYFRGGNLCLCGGAPVAADQALRTPSGPFQSELVFWVVVLAPVRPSHHVASQLGPWMSWHKAGSTKDGPALVEPPPGLTGTPNLVGGFSPGWAASIPSWGRSPRGGWTGSSPVASPSLSLSTASSQVPPTRPAAPPCTRSARAAAPTWGGSA